MIQSYQIFGEAQPGSRGDYSTGLGSSLFVSVAVALRSLAAGYGCPALAAFLIQ